MPEIARCAVESQRETTGGRGLVFPGVTPKIFQETMDTIKIGAMALPGLVCKEAVAQLTAHKLRHSLNTNLMLAGANPLLVRTYLSWEHQGSNAVQAGYTHVYARNLLPVARVIDDMYSQDVIDKAIGFPAGRGDRTLPSVHGDCQRPGESFPNCTTESTVGLVDGSGWTSGCLHMRL